MVALRNLISLKSGFESWKLPLLFILSVAIFTLVLPCSSSYATDGYMTRVRADYDGFIAGSADGNQSANLWVLGTKRNSNFNYVGYYGNYPYLCYPKNGSPYQDCINQAYTGGANAKQFETTLINGGTVVGAGYNYMANVEYSLQNQFTIPQSWYGNKVIVSWDFEFGSYFNGGYIQKSSSVVQLNWGAVTVYPSSASNVCVVPFSFVNEGADNDFIRFAFDFTEVSSSDCTSWDWFLSSRPTSSTVPTNGHKFLHANFNTEFNVYSVHPYIAYDIIPPEAGGELEEIVDDWKTQQEQEFEAIQNTASSAGTTANGILSVFNFAIVDPLMGMFALFTDNSCVNIPIIGSMIHVTNTQVCSPWSAQVRQVLTPVFTIGGTLLLWGFVMNWLRNDGAMVEVSEHTTSFRSKS